MNTDTHLHTHTHSYTSNTSIIMQNVSKNTYRKLHRSSRYSDLLFHVKLYQTILQFVLY